MAEIPGGGATDFTLRDRVNSALCFVSLGAFGVIVLLNEGLRSRHFVRYHAAHSVALGIPLILVGLTGIGPCMVLPVWFLMLVVAWRTYRGITFVVPVLTDFLTNRGWA